MYSTVKTNNSNIHAENNQLPSVSAFSKSDIDTVFLSSKIFQSVLLLTPVVRSVGLVLVFGFHTPLECTLAFLNSYIQEHSSSNPHPVS